MRTGQLRPAELSRQRFLDDQAHFLQTVEREGLDVRLYASAFNPYPFAIASSHLEELTELQHSVRRAVLAVVKHFFRDSRISEVIHLPENELSLLRELDSLPYRPGGFRPDFLHAAGGGIRITEINARFALNGFLSSALLNRSLDKLGGDFRALPALRELPDALHQRLGESGRIGLVKSSEPGWDINLLRGLWGDRCEMKAPGELTSADCARFQSVLLELHQSELWRELSRERLLEIARHPGVLNDLRTILIVHDKRLLSLLSTSPILEDYLSEADLARLRRQVTPTWVKGLSPEKVAEAMEVTSGWLAKPPRSGKGKGIVVSSALSPEEWRRTLSELPEDYLLQPYVEQREFPIATLVEGELVEQSMRVVGVLPQLDEHVFGAGMFRAAADTIVNVARGGLILTPSLVEG